MPNIKSVKKNVARSFERRDRNRSVRSSVKTHYKKSQALIHLNDVTNLDAITISIGITSSVVDRAAKRGIIHKNKASRLKSRLMSRMQILINMSKDSIENNENVKQRSIGRSVMPSPEKAVSNTTNKTHTYEKTGNPFSSLIIPFENLLTFINPNIELFPKEKKEISIQLSELIQLSSKFSNSKNPADEKLLQKKRNEIEEYILHLLNKLPEKPE